MDIILGIAILMVIGAAIYEFVLKDDTPKEKRKREESIIPPEPNPNVPPYRYLRAGEWADLGLPNLAPLDLHKLKYLELMECIIQLQACPKATLFWDEHAGWYVQFDDQEKLYGGGIPFVDSVTRAIQEYNPGPPPPPQNGSQFHT